MKNRIEFILYKIFKSLIRLLPFKLRYAFADFIGILIYKIAKSRRNITIKNIKIAFPKLNEIEIDELAKKAYKNISRTFLELLWIDQLDIEIQGVEILEEVKNRNKGAVLLGLHIGNWECIGNKIAKCGFDIHAVFKKMKNPYINQEVIDIRSQTGMTLIEKGRNTSLKPFIKAIKTKALLGLIADQYAKDIEIEFFGKKTTAPIGTANFSIKFDMPIVLIYSYRKELNKHVVLIEKEVKNILSDNNEKDLQVNTQNYIYEMERIIKKYPEQWFWQHKRWRD